MRSKLEGAPISLGTFLSNLLLGSLALLLVFPLPLDSGGGLILLVLLHTAVIAVKLHVCKLFPQLIKLRIVLLYVVLVIDNDQIFLIGVPGGNSPIEGASDHVRIINNHELIVHVGVGSVVDSHWDASL